MRYCMSELRLCCDNGETLYSKKFSYESLSRLLQINAGSVTATKIIKTHIIALSSPCMLIFQQRFIRKLLDNLDGITKVCNPRFVISTVGRNLNDIIVVTFTRFLAS